MTERQPKKKKVVEQSIDAVATAMQMAKAELWLLRSIVLGEKKEKNKDV